MPGRDDVKCTEKCGGSVDLSRYVENLQIGCASWAPVFACNKCGRLHFNAGDGVSRRNGERAFWKEGEVIYKPPKKSRAKRA